MRPRSYPARIAAAPSIRAAAAPLVTSPASAPVTSAITRDAAAWSWSSGTHSRAAATNASRTSAGMGAPPSRVTAPEALMTGSRPH